MFKTSIFIILSLLWSHIILAQQAVDSLRGKIVIKLSDDVEVPAIGAKLFWLGTTNICSSNPLGQFVLPVTDTNQKNIVVQHRNAKQDTFVLYSLTKEVELGLQPKIKQKEALVVGRSNSTKISYLNPVLTININKHELLKAACCNLSESFETTPSVDVAYSDAITGQKQIQMLGLASPYTTITQENIPSVRGIASAEGMSYTPGTWVDGIQLSKGTGSVVNGYESLAGQINIELQKPDKADRFLVNVYQSAQGRSELNLHLNRGYKRFAHGLLLHYKNQWLKMDNNADNFYDNPLGNQKIGLYRWQYFSASGYEIQGGIKGLYITNQNSFINSTMPVGYNWEYNQNTKRTEGFMKIGKVYANKPWKSIGLQLAGFMHTTKLLAGEKKYGASQNNFYSNLIFQTVLGNTNHGIKTGLNFVADEVREDFPDTLIGHMQRFENVAGIFVEHSYNYLKKLNLVTGIRCDYNNLYGLFFTPRIHLRYSPSSKHVFRLSMGRAQRTANVLSENLKGYFSNRVFEFKGNIVDWQKGINPEIAWNTGLSYSYDFEINYRKASWVTDYYYSWFKKQYIADYENFYKIVFYNLNGKSYAHSLQTQFDYSPAKRTDIRLAYRWYDVKMQYDEKLLEKPLVSKHRAFCNIAYGTKNKWRFDATYVIVGQKRISDGNALTTSLYNYSPSYSLVNFQITKSLKRNFEIYFGGENVTNFMQHHAVVSYNNPEDKAFDASQIWGPVMGSNYYIGVRYSIK